MPKLAGAAADHAREVLALSFPREGWWMRTGIAFMDLVLRVMRREFQAFYHPPKKILATCEQHGLKTVVNRPGIAWTVAAFRRAT
jgi:magnesium-protoporphyrin O-methyltransferase